MNQSRRPKGTRQGGELGGTTRPEPPVVELGGASGIDLPVDLLPYLPEATADTWRKIADLIPASAYLAGGTGLTVHLRHRASRDLDFMLERVEDLGAIRDSFDASGC